LEEDDIRPVFNNFKTTEVGRESPIKVVLLTILYGAAGKEKRLLILRGYFSVLPK
jgi:hypothetical protein